MKALFFTSNYYESPIQVGDQHLARAFAHDGWDIGFISTPISPLHLLGGISTQLQQRFDNYRQEGQLYQIGPGTIWSYVPAAWLTPKNLPFLRSAWLFDHWHQLSLPNLPRLLSQHGFDEVDLLYIRDPKQSLWLDRISYKASIYRLADYESGFSHFETNTERMEKKLAQKVDMIAYTAHTLEPYARALAPQKLLYLPNGVSLSDFNDLNPPKPPDLIDIDQPIVIYVGTIDYWFDFDLVNWLSGEFPEIAFVIIGPLNTSPSRFIQRPNLHLLSSRPYSEITQYLHHADIALIPFNRQDYANLIDSVNPIKLYEYLASGLPVVATWWQELEQIHSPALLCQTSQDFKQAIQKLIEKPIEKTQLIDFAMQYDWSSSYQILMEALTPFLSKN